MLRLSLFFLIFPICCGAQVPYPISSSPVNISSIEFVLDNPNNIGTTLLANGTLSDYNNIFTTINLGALPQGFHRIYFKAKDANGIYSLVNNAFFDNYSVPIYASATNTPNVKQVEFFIDTLVPMGGGTPIIFNPNNINLNNYSTIISFLPLISGGHNIYFRTQDTFGNWSLANKLYFDNFIKQDYPIAPSISSIVTVEYFIDNNDLGFGNCTPIYITPNTTIANLSANIIITGLAQGVHRLQIRAKDTNDNWSLTNIAIFDNSLTPSYPNTPPLSVINEMEYFIDVDPGFGLGTPIILNNNLSDINNLNVNIDVTGLNNANHQLCIRSKQNPWSLTTIVPFTVGIPFSSSWTYLKASLVNQSSEISWGDMLDEQIDYYMVEKSIDGNVFIEMKKVAALFNVNQLNYKVMDDKTNDGFNFYRIKKVKRNGAVEYSETLTVFNPYSLTTCLLVPNPANEFLNISAPTNHTIQKITLLSFDGKLILEKDIQNHYLQLNLQSLPIGNYFVKIQTDNGLYTHQFVKK